MPKKMSIGGVLYDAGAPAHQHGRWSDRSFERKTGMKYVLAFILGCGILRCRSLCNEYDTRATLRSLFL